MAADGKVVIDTTLDTAGALSGMNRLTKTIKAGLAALVTAGGTAAGAIVKTGISYNANMEMYQASLESLLGSSEKATAMMKELSDFAAKTPFEMSGLADAATMMLGFGLATEDILPNLQMLGDISMGNSEKMKSLTLAFSQIGASGKATMEDINQMIDAGFNPLTIIAEKTGESMEDLRKRVSDGGVSFDEIREAMVTATSEGGRFYQAMEKQSQTMKGQWSTVMDDFNSKCGELTKPLSEHITKETLPALDRFIQKIDAQKVLSSFEKGITAVTTALKLMIPATAAAAGAAGLGKIVSMSKTTTTSLQTMWRQASMDAKAYDTVVAYAAKNQLTYKEAVVQYNAAYGELNGQLGKVATAQGLVHSGMTQLGNLIKANPIAALSVAVGVVTTAYEAWDEAAHKVTDETQALFDHEKALIENNTALAESVTQRQESFETTASQYNAEIAYAQYLSDELSKITDSNGKIKEGYEARAAYIAGELTEATGIEIELNNGLIANYQEINRQVEDYINNLILRAYQQAATEGLEAAVAQEMQLQQAYNETDAVLQDAYARRNELADYYSAHMDEMSVLEKTRMDNEISAVEDTIKELEASQEELTDSTAETQADIQYYSELAAQLSGENADEAVAKLQNAGKTASQDIKKVNSGITSDLKSSGAKQKDTAGDTGQGIKKGLGKAKGGADAVEDLCDDINSELDAEETTASSKSEDIGEGIDSGVASGIGGNSRSVFSAIGGVVNDAIAWAKDLLGINSPSKLFRDVVGSSIPEGIAVGIEDNFDDVQDKLGEGLNAALKYAGQIDFAMPDRAQEMLQKVQVHFAEPELQDNRTIVIKIGETTLAAVVDRGNRKLRLITGREY